MQNVVSEGWSETSDGAVPSVAERLAREAVGEREAEYAAEVTRLLDAGLRVIRRLGTDSSPRVADIVAEAGVSNGVFYRHFQSKDELVTALLEVGTARMHSSLVQRMATVDDPAEQIRRWVAGILAPTQSAETADEIRSVLWNGARVSDDSRRRVAARETLARPLQQPLGTLGSDQPDEDSLTMAHTVLGRLDEYLWRRYVPTTDEVDRLATFCLRAVGGSVPSAAET